MGISRNGDDAMMMHMAKREERGAGLLKGHKKMQNQRKHVTFKIL